MSDVVWAALDPECPGWAYAMVLATLCVTATLVGVVNRTHRLLRAYYLEGDWPGMVQHDERGPGTCCEVCGHHLSVHDRGTGRCCYGTPLERVAIILALPLPLLVRDMLQQAGCPCHRIGQRP